MPYIECPGCERALKIPERYLGRWGHCKRCGHRFKPELRPAPAVAPAPNPQPANAPAAASAAHYPQPAPNPQPAPKPRPPVQPRPEASTPKKAADAPAPARRAGRFARWRGGGKAAPAPSVKERLTPLEALLRWLDELPRSHPSFSELEARRSKPLFLSVDDLARSKVYLDVPVLLAQKHDALMLVKTTQDNISQGTPQAVSSGKLDIEVTYYPTPEYPVVRVLATIHDDPERPLKFESLPLLTHGDTLEFFATALRLRRVSFALYAGSQSNHVATAELALDADRVRDIGNALVQAIRQWRKSRPGPDAHDGAIRRFTREVPL